MRCEVLVVGGGPAGLATAIALRQRGIDVLVADALRLPIDKACGEGLMPDSLAALSQLGIAIPPDWGARFEGIAFVSQGFRAAARFPRGEGIGIRRTALHSLLAARAAELGVRMAWGSQVSLHPDGRVGVGGAVCRYGFLIGADGQQSRVRHWSGLDQGGAVLRRFGRRMHLNLSRGERFRFVEVHWGCSGQAYVTPVGANQICIATVARSHKSTFEDVLNGLPGLKERLLGAEASSRMRGSITTTRRLRRVARGNIALVGDASGSADAVTGEGLALSFRQALLLAECLDSGDLALYDAGHSSILRWPRRESRIILALDRFPWLRHRAIELLAHNPGIFARLLAMHVREQSAGESLRIPFHLFRGDWSLRRPASPSSSCPVMRTNYL